MEKSRSFYNKPLFRWLLRAGITVAFVVMVNRGVTPGQVKGLASSLQSVPLCLALLLAALSLYFQVLRWQAVLKVLGFAGRFRESASTFIWGNLLGFLTPGRAGELGRGIGLDPARKANSVAAVLVDKAFGVAATLLFGAVAMAAQVTVFGVRPPGYLTAFMMALLIALPLVFLFVMIALKRTDFFGRPGPLFRVLRNIAGVRHRLFNWRIIGYSAVAHILLLLQTVVALEMLGCGGAVKNIMIGAEAYAFMLFLPFFIANIGLREYSFSLMVGNLTPSLASGVTPSALVLGISTLVLVMNVIAPAMAGLCVMAIDRKHKATV